MAQESWKREKDETDCKIKEGLILCVNNCGLFGSPTTLNMCAKCYAEHLLKKPNSPPSPTPPSPPSSAAATAAAPPPTSLLQVIHPSLSPSAPALLLSSSSSPLPPCPSSKETPAKRPRDPETAIEDRPAKMSTNVLRCSGCQKRVGLTGFRCRCGDIFCARHRYSDAHDCSYDYKAAGREAIARENPVVKAAKIIKI